MSPCPGGYQLDFSLSAEVGQGRSDSLSTRGYRDCSKVRMLMLWFWYFWIIRAVSSLVLNEFMRMNGTLTLYLELRCWGELLSAKLRQSLLPICLIVPHRLRSRRRAPLDW